jgi:hypothetical protein
VLVHFGTQKTEHYLLVRLDKPENEGAGNANGHGDDPANATPADGGTIGGSPAGSADPSGADPQQ